MTCLVFILGIHLLDCLIFRLLGRVFKAHLDTVPALTGSVGGNAKLLSDGLPLRLVRWHQHNDHKYEGLKIYLEVALSGDHLIKEDEVLVHVFGTTGSRLLSGACFGDGHLDCCFLC